MLLNDHRPAPEKSYISYSWLVMNMMQASVAYRMQLECPLKSRSLGKITHSSVLLLKESTFWANQLVEPRPIHNRCVWLEAALHRLIGVWQYSSLKRERFKAHRLCQHTYLLNSWINQTIEESNKWMTQ